LKLAHVHVLVNHIEVHKRQDARKKL
jgi:hypothetical protein